MSAQETFLEDEILLKVTLKRTLRVLYDIFLDDQNTKNMEEGNVPIHEENEHCENSMNFELTSSHFCCVVAPFALYISFHCVYQIIYEFIH